MNTTAAHHPESVAQRLLERFAFLVFSLYHLPLFLNNYPSLGGGGFSDTGLAPRWGHVFTPVGVWVARHVFHLTGPMSGAYQGDNGDVGEEYGRLLLSVVIAVVAAVWWTLADRRRPRGGWVPEATKTLLRYSIALGLVSYGIAKLLPMQFPPLSLITLEQRLGDLSPMSLLWSFMQYSRPYAFFGGVMEMVAVVLLCFRRTTTLGALVCLAVMTNVALLNYAYGVPVKLYATMIVASAGVLVLYDAHRILAVFVRNQAAPPVSFSPLFQDRLSGPVRWTIKVALVGSVILSSVIAMRQAIGAATTQSALDGGWVVSSFARDGQSLDSTANPERWRRVVVDGGRMVIRLENDALVNCRQQPSPDADAFALECTKGRKGELHWTRTGDSLRLDGTFNGAKVTASGHHLDRSDYALLRSQFRLISDR
ncbi:MAG: hypothetical protein ABJF01_03250 [bacterium]